MVPPERGGLDILFDWLIAKYANEPEDEEDEDVENFEGWSREPGQAIRSFILDFEQRYDIAEATGQIDSNPRYKTRLFFQKGKISERDQYDFFTEGRW